MSSTNVWHAQRLECLVGVLGDLHRSGAEEEDEIVERGRRHADSGGFKMWVIGGSAAMRSK
jgi:hypothetical protein